MALHKTKNRNGATAAGERVRTGRRPALALLLMLAALTGLALGLLPTVGPLASAQVGGAAAGQGDGQRGTREADRRPKRPLPRASAQKKVGSQGAATNGAAKAGVSAAKSAVGVNALMDELLPPVLASADFDLVGLAVTATPATQTVPKNTQTSVLTSVRVPEGGDPSAIIAGLNTNLRVRGELVGPSLAGPLALETKIGQPLVVPPLNQAGEHLVQNLRVVDITAPQAQEAVVAPVLPDACGINVIERLLISEVRVNELNYEQIRQAGIVLSNDSYRAFNFTLGLATTSNVQTINIPVAFPPVGVNPPRPIVGSPTMNGPGVDVPTIVPVMLTPALTDEGGAPTKPEIPMIGDEPLRIPGVIVFPGRVGFLNQFFEAIVIVSNGAPGGTPLVLRGLRAKAKLPDAGTPGVTSDDPLRIAETQTGGRVSELDLHGLGADNKYGTADDLLTLKPGEAGQGTFLLEGLKEGMHTVNFELEAMLEGLPSGPVKVTGAVPGAVLVRDASFAVTFTHPSVVRAGQEYDLAMTVYNTGSTDIQGAFAQLARASISGAEMLGQDTGERQFRTTIKRKDQATIKWRLRSNTTGEVTASYVKVGDDITAGLALVTGVGDRNVPLSPDSLILPDPVRHLPPGVVEAARGVLGQAWSIANAPPGSLPQGVLPMTKQGVIDRAVEVGLAGMRVDFGEPVSVSLDTLMRDWLGELTKDEGWADALRNSPSGAVFYDSVGAEIYKRLDPSGASPVTPADFHRELADAESPRSPFVSALVTHAAGQPVAGARFVNSRGEAVGFGTPGERAGNIPTGGAMRLVKTDPATGAVVSEMGQMALVSEPGAENVTLEIQGWQTGSVDISLLYPGTSRTYRQVVWSGVPVEEGRRYRVIFKPSSSATTAPILELLAGNNYAPAATQGTLGTLSPPAPRLVGAVQVTPDVIAGGDKYGRLVGLLFSKPMLREQATNAAKYAVGGGKHKTTQEAVGGLVKVKGAALDYGDRFVFLSLDAPIGPYIERDLTVTGVGDARRVPLAPSPTTMRIDPRVSPRGVPPGAYLTGRVLNADGTPVAGANVIYWTQECPNPALAVLPPPPEPIAVSVTDAQGRYGFDYVRDGDCAPLSVTVQNPATQSEKRLTSPVAYDGQRMVFDMVFLARGHVRGTVMSGTTPVPNAFVSIIPALDVVGAQVVRTDESGNYSARDIPVGHVSITAVGTGQYVLASGLAAGVIPGPNLTAVVDVSVQNISGSAAGRVLRADNTASAGALVIAYARIPGFGNRDRADGKIPAGYAYADADGRFAISNLPLNDITLEVTDYVTGLRASRGVTLTPQAPAATGLLIVLPGSGSAAGRVLDETGAPVAEALVFAAGQAVKSDAAGDFVLRNLTAGLHTISARHPQTGQSGAAAAQIRMAETTGGVQIVIRRPAVVQGRVFIVEEGSTTPKPAGGAYVSSDGSDIVQADAQGNYRLNAVSPSTQLYLRYVKADKYLSVIMPVVLSPGETLTRDVTFRPGTIRGRVTQPDGVTGTIADVNVFSPRANLNPGPDFGTLSTEVPRTTRTNADGHYTLSGNNPGQFRVSTSNPFFPTGVSAGGNLAPGGTAECNLTLVNTLTGKIQGRVFQPDGVTPVGANVRVTLGGGSLADATVRTDDEGRYEFGEVFSAGGYSLTATDLLTGLTNRVGVSVQRNRDAFFDIRLLGTGSLKVKVVDGAGQPVANASVNLNGSEYPHANRFAVIAPGMDGTIEFSNLSEGAYAVAAADRGLGGRAAVTVARGATVETTIQLQASGTVEGRVFMPGGTTPVGLADVKLRAGGRIVGFSVTTDGDPDATGHFKFFNVPAGDFTLDVFDNRTGRSGRSTGRITTQGETATINVELLAAGAVTGRVTANGIPVDHALVQISADGSGVSHVGLKATTDSDGRYRFPGIPVGRFTVTVTDAPGGQGGQVSGVVSGNTEPLPDTVADIALAPTQTVTGTVYRPGGGEPVAGARVRVGAGGHSYSTTSNELGVYRISFIPLGEVRVRAESPAGYDRGESEPVTGSQPGGTVTANVTFAGTGSVRGLATDNNGSPLTFGSVVFANTAWGERVEIMTAVRPDGTYEINNAPVGDFTLRLTVPDRVGVGTGASAILAGQTVEVPLRIEDAGRVTGRVTHEDGTPAHGADVTLSLWRANGRLVFYSHSDAQGAFTFENVPLGAVTLHVYDPATVGGARRYNVPLVSNAQTLDLGTLRLHRTPFGAVKGVVVNAQSTAFAGAQVTLTAPNGTFTATTDAQGQFHFEPVDGGAFVVEAFDPATGFRDRAEGSITQDEQVATQHLQLVARGRITGTVFRPDGTTPVAGARVQVRNDSFFSTLATLTADAQGRYTTGLLAVGNYNIVAEHEATGDRGHAVAQLTSNEQTVTSDVSLRGFGQVVVTVTTATGSPVAGARVTVTSAWPFSENRTLDTQPDGTATFAQVRAGAFNVTANEPSTGLSGAGQGSLTPGATAALSVSLEPTGTVEGTVYRHGGTTPAAGVELTVRRPNNQVLATVTADAQGRYSFPLLRLGDYQIDASEAATGDRGRTTARVEAAGQTVAANFNMQGVGQVVVTVTTATGSPVEGAQVSLSSQGPLSSSHTLASGPGGVATFTGVLAGSLSVNAHQQATGLTASGAGTLAPGGTANITVALEPTGTLEGTVFRHDGATPVPGAQVRVTRGGFYSDLFTLTADAQGRFSTAQLRLGSYQLEARDPATGDAGYSEVQITAAGQVVPSNVTMRGLGRVVVTVTNAAGAPVSGANVTLTASGPPVTVATLSTGADGTATFNAVLAGNIYASASDPATGLHAEAQSSVGRGETASVALQLEPIGSVTGRVLAPDGTTPVAGAVVRLNSWFNFSPVTTGPDGTYRFNNVRLGGYNVNATDQEGRPRASVVAEVTANDEVVTRDLVFEGIGTVNVRVKNPNGTPAQSVVVAMRSDNDHLGNVFFANEPTDAAGAVAFEGVVAGQLRAVVDDRVRRLYGEASGTLSQDGETVTLDIGLINNAVNLPVTRFDGNSFPFAIQSDGTIRYGINQVWRGDFSTNVGGFNLDLIAGGTEHRFGGSGFGGTSEDGGREIAVRQSGLAGLNVTRKVYVPTAGYFARYLEILHNPTADPVTVSLRVKSHFAFCWNYCGATGVVSTSSGDQQLGVGADASADRWAVLDNPFDYDPFEYGDTPSTAYAFDGEGAQSHADHASYTPGGPQTFAYGWQEVVIQPGETVAYMHFGLQQVTRAAAQASVERLTQLPPEALAGLSEEELGQIRNFAVPAGGTSTLAPLPGIDGRVTGRVTGSDNTSWIAGARVEFKSDSPYFPRTLRATASGTGDFSFNYYQDNNSTIAIPRGPFTLKAYHPRTSIWAPPTPGDFPPGQAIATQNVIFPDTGNLTVNFRRHTGAPVVNATVYARNNTTGYNFEMPSVGGGAYVVWGVPPGEYTFEAYAHHPQGEALKGTGAVTLAVNQSATVDISTPPTGRIVGTVRKADGAPSPDTSVSLRRDVFYHSRSDSTDAAGQFELTDVPVGTYTLVATDPFTGIERAAQVTVTQDATTTQDITLGGVGSVQVTVKNADGSLAANSRVTIKEITRDFFRFGGYTGADGRLLLNNIPAGPFAVRAQNPNNTHLEGEAVGEVIQHGSIVPVTVTLPGTGIVRGRVTYANGSPAASADVRLEWAWTEERSSYTLWATTNANGEYTISGVEVGRAFTFVAVHPDNGNIYRRLRSQIITTAGQTLTLDAALPAAADVRVTVLKSDGTPHTDANVVFKSSVEDYDRYMGSTDASGRVLVETVPSGDFAVRAHDRSTDALLGSATGTVAETNHGQTVEVTINSGRGGSVRGTIFFAGQPRSGVRVDLLDEATGVEAHYDAVEVNEPGQYRFDNVRAGDRGFRVRVWLPWGYGGYIDTVRSFSTEGETVTVDVTLPGGVVKGRVYRSDGTTPAPYANIWITQPREGEDAFTFYSNADEHGSFVFEGVGVGEFTVFAQADSSGLTGSFAGRLTDTATPVVADVTMPPAGKVRGTVRNPDGTAASSVEVLLTQSGSRAQSYTYTDEAGQFEFDGVGLGSFYAQALRGDGIFGSAVGSVSAANETVTADITFPATTTLSGTIRRPDGVAPVVQARVYVESFSNAGTRGRWAQQTQANANGAYSLEGVPLGLVRVTALPQVGSSPAGETEVTLAAGGPATADVTLGNIVAPQDTITLVGADGFRYQFWDYGAMGGGGTVDDLQLEAYNGAFNLTFQDEEFWYENEVRHDNFGTAAVEEGGREYVFGYDAIMGLLVKRKVYVPPSGGFARFLEILRNPTDKPITVVAGHENAFGYYRPWEHRDTRFNVLVSPSQTGNTYAVTEFRDKCCYPALAHVFAGPNARVPMRDVKVWNIDDDEAWSNYHWKVTVQPGQTVALMHFTAQRAGTDTAGAQAQAEALAALSDPRALEGMSAEERAQVVNFRIDGAGSQAAGKVAVQVNYDGGGPAANAPVYIQEAARGNATREAGRTDAAGRVTIHDVLVGPFTVKAYNPETAALSGEAAGTAAAGETTAVTVTLATAGMVSGRVTNANGTPLEGALIEVAGAELPARTTTTDRQGRYRVPGMPFGRAFTVKATRADEASVSATSAEQTLTAAAPAASVDHTLAMPTWVYGWIRAGDGQTPASGAIVEVLDAATGRQLEQHPYTVNSDGLYVTGWLFVGTPGVRVRVTHPAGGEFIAETSATLAPGAEALGDVNMTLPLAVVRGAVKRADGTPAPDPILRLTQENGAGGTQVSGVIGDSNGNYTLIGFGAGNFSLEARDPDGTSTTVPGTVADISVPVVLNVTLPAGTVVTGTVTDAAGAPVPFAEVSLVRIGEGYNRWLTADAQGVYRAERHAPGTIFVQARHPETFLSATAFGTVAAQGGDTLTLNLQLPAAGTVRGTVRRADGTTPVAGADVRIENLAGAGGHGHFEKVVTTDASGAYEVTGVQVGSVRVTAFDPSDATVAGVTHVTLAAGGSAQADVTLGGAVALRDWDLPYNLDGADGFRYDIHVDGDMDTGGKTDGSLTGAYWGSHYLAVDHGNWWYWNTSEAATLEDGGREVVIASDAWGGLHMTRKVYVPAGGGFARYLEIIRNHTDRPLTYFFEMKGWTGFFDDTRVGIGPAQTANTYVVLTDATGARPTIAEVLAGPEAAAPVTATNFQQRTDFSYGWKVTVQPGQTVALMHFAIQREPADAAGAQAQAEALATLSDPRALEGMSAEERAQVVNFRITNQAGVKNENRNPQSLQKRDAVNTRRPNAGVPAASGGGSVEAFRTRSGIRADGFGRQGLQRR